MDRHIQRVLYRWFWWIGYEYTEANLAVFVLILNTHSANIKSYNNSYLNTLSLVNTVATSPTMMMMEIISKLTIYVVCIQSQTQFFGVWTKERAIKMIAIKTIHSRQDNLSFFFFVFWIIIERWLAGRYPFLVKLPARNIIRLLLWKWDRNNEPIFYVYIYFIVLAHSRVTPASN